MSTTEGLRSRSFFDPAESYLWRFDIGMALAPDDQRFALIVRAAEGARPYSAA